MRVHILKMSFALGSVLNKREAEKIRGFLGNLFWDNPYAHQHAQDGTLLYRYPRIQYKVINGLCLLIGFNEGLEIAKKAFYNLNSVNLDGDLKEVISRGLESYTESFKVSNSGIIYTFLTPWLALNEKNYEAYQKTGNPAQRKKQLENILAANLISISKSLGYTVPAPINTHILKLKEVPTSLKSTPMLGFLGTFSVNFEIPDYWGIGKSVSRGFGTVKRISSEEAHGSYSQQKKAF